MKKGLLLSILFIFSLSSCINQEPKEVNLHSDECAYCKMVISDKQFASQMVSDKGKSYLFDSIECMAAYAYQSPDVVNNAKLYIGDYTERGKWLLIDNADIYHAESVASPMGLSIFALPEEKTMPVDIKNAEQMTWDEIIKFVVEQWDVKR